MSYGEPKSWLAWLVVHDYQQFWLVSSIGSSCGETAPSLLQEWILRSCIPLGGAGLEVLAKRSQQCIGVVVVAGSSC